jgi:hypothetical protein
VSPGNAFRLSDPSYLCVSGEPQQLRLFLLATPAHTGFPASVATNTKQPDRGSFSLHHAEWLRGNFCRQAVTRFDRWSLSGDVTTVDDKKDAIPEAK